MDGLVRLPQQIDRDAEDGDDPPLFATNLTREYLGLHRTFGYDKLQLARLALNGVRHAFLEESERSNLERRFVDELAALGVVVESDDTLALQP